MRRIHSNRYPYTLSVVSLSILIAVTDSETWPLAQVRWLGCSATLQQDKNRDVDDGSGVY